MLITNAIIFTWGASDQKHEGYELYIKNDREWLTHTEAEGFAFKVWQRFEENFA